MSAALLHDPGGGREAGQPSQLQRERSQESVRRSGGLPGSRLRLGSGAPAEAADSRPGTPSSTAGGTSRRVVALLAELQSEQVGPCMLVGQGPAPQFAPTRPGLVCCGCRQRISLRCGTTRAVHLSAELQPEPAGVSRGWGR